MSFRSELFEVAGGFRDGIGRIGSNPVGCEETELCIRAAQKMRGGHFLFVPGARVFHHVPASRARGSYFRARCYAEGLSKALVTRHVGQQDGLSSEWSYTLQTLPKGVFRGLLDLLRGRPDGVSRAAAIVVGLLITTAGYLRGNWAGRDTHPAVEVVA
jgi:hypothetical protein